MRVTLIDYTGAGFPDPAAYAAGLLCFTKETRLTMSPGALQAAMARPMEAKLEELAYMANTIPSSWEFIDYTFLIEGVTRAFTHQLVRTRQASYAQQTMRILNVRGWEYAAGPTIVGDRKALYDQVMRHIADGYAALIEDGAEIEDARGVLPTNILTNIVMKIDMRAFVDLVRKRSSIRTQGEYRDVLVAMRAEAMAAHGWLALFLERTVDKIIADMEAGLLALPLSREQVNPMVKLLDQLRAQL